MSIVSIEEAIRYILVNDVAVGAITTRCYPATLPQDPTFPLILYYRITGLPDNTLSDTSGLTYSRFQVEAWAETYDEAKTLARAITSTLNAQSYIQDSIIIGSIVQQGERDFYEDAVPCYRVIQDYTLWHTT